MRTNICLYRRFVLVRGGFCLEGFVWGVFCPFPLLLEYICYNRKLNNTFNFRFHMYENLFYKCDVTCSWTPPPVTNCHAFPDPLEHDVLYERLLISIVV